MAASSSPIKLQKVESELTLQFQIDDLQAWFTRTSSSKYTEYFGPGLRFGTCSVIDAEGNGHLGLYLYTSREYPPISPEWTVLAKSLSGQTYQIKSMTYNFKSGEAIGWSKFLAKETYSNNTTMQSENAILVHARLKFAPLWPIVFSPTLDVVHQALCGEAALDTRFIVYAKRNSNGRLSTLRALEATQDAMTRRRSGMFSDIYEGRTAIILGSVLKEDEQAKSTVFTTYRDEDSDFEDGDEDSEESDMTDSQTSLRSALSRDRDHPASGASSRVTLIKPEPTSQDLALVPEATVKPVKSTIVLTGVAAQTWEAFLYWIYTGTIVFAPLNSSGQAARTTFINQYHTGNPDRPKPVSCKSVYRLAGALQLDSLKKRALDHLEGQLSPKTYLHELFSEFTSHHDEIRKLEMLAVVKHWDSLKGSAELKEKIQDVVSGKLPHAGQILADLLLRTSIKDEVDESK